MARRRTRSPHPGVVLIPPEADHPTWRARYRDADTGRMTKVRLDPEALRTHETRREWAIRKSRTLGKRRMDLDAGAPRATGTALAAAVDTYFRDHPMLRDSTRELYRRHADALLEWARGAGVRSGDDLTRERLVAFRASRVRVTRNAPVAGGKKGERTGTAETRAASTINLELRVARVVLGYLRSLGLAARLTSDDLRDALKLERVYRERIDAMNPVALQRLLDAAMRHDADTFKITRSGLLTPRYVAIAPFVATVLLSGMRRAEALTLDWDQVDLDAIDHAGRRVGEIRLTTRTKTHKPRDVGLEVSPALRALLAALKLRSGGKGSVFGLSSGEARAALRRLPRYGAPKFTWQTLRQTCGSYLSNAPGIYGAAAAWHSAKQLGHSVTVAERHYVGRVRGIPVEARTLEAAMQIEPHMSRIISAASTARPTRIAR